MDVVWIQEGTPWGSLVAGVDSFSPGALRMIGRIVTTTNAGTGDGGNRE